MLRLAGRKAGVTGAAVEVITGENQCQPVISSAIPGGVKRERQAASERCEAQFLV